MTDNFKGDTPHLIRCIEALLALDAAGVLVPHGVGGHARTLLEAAAVRLNVPAPDLSTVCATTTKMAPNPQACTVCGYPEKIHGSYPTCASHPYTPDGSCKHVLGATCAGAECRNGCVRAGGGPR